MVDDICYKLHSLFNSMSRFTFESIDDIPFKNGVYIFFEKGEKYGELDRIVRVGTDTGQNQLVSRLRQHLLNENKDRSIFRKNIGRAILARDNNDLIDYWNIDLTSKKNREMFFEESKSQACKEMEKRVSDYMREAFSFVVFPLQTKEERLRYEEAIISALYRSSDFIASKTWLGEFIPPMRGNHIREARMWLSQGLKAEPLTENEYKNLIIICNGEMNENRVN